MRRVLCCLGALGILAGAGFVPPSVASAAEVPFCTPPLGGFDTSFSAPYISESTTFQVTPEDLANQGGLPGHYVCTIPGLTLAIPQHYDLIDASGVVSDNLSVFQPSSTTPGLTVDLLSETDGGLAQGRTGTAVPEVAMCPGLSPETCDGARIDLGIRDVNNNEVFLTVISDTPPSLGGGEVPEPSTGLLLAAALPALLGVRRRFSMRVSA